MELLPLVLVVVVFWLFIIRPQRNRARELAAVQGALLPGQTVMTGSGLIATVAEVHDDEVHLEVAPGVRSRYARQAVVRVVDDPTTGSADATDVADRPGSEVVAEPEPRGDGEPPAAGR